MRWRTASGERLPASNCVASSAPPCCVTVSCASAPAKLVPVNCRASETGLGASRGGGCYRVGTMEKEGGFYGRLGRAARLTATPLPARLGIGALSSPEMSGRVSVAAPPPPPPPSCRPRRARRRPVTVTPLSEQSGEESWHAAQQAPGAQLEVDLPRLRHGGGRGGGVVADEVPLARLACQPPPLA
eukprot:scaffold71636_cov51-Phaeocystis_antarctica.AAC.2